MHIFSYMLLAFNNYETFELFSGESDIREYYPGQARPGRWSFFITFDYAKNIIHKDERTSFA